MFVIGQLMCRKNQREPTFARASIAQMWKLMWSCAVTSVQRAQISLARLIKSSKTLGSSVKAPLAMKAQIFPRAACLGQSASLD
jgi:hypothetical protein